MAATIKFWNAYTSPATDGGYSLGSTDLQFLDLYLTGSAYIDALGDHLLAPVDVQIQFRDSSIYVVSNNDGHLDLNADLNIDFLINTVEQINLQDGKLVPTTDDDVDLGDTTHEYKNTYTDGTAFIDTLELHDTINLVFYEEDLVAYEGEAVFYA